MDEHKPNRCYGFCLYFTEDEKQWLRVLAEKDGISMAEEVRQLIMDRKNMVLQALNGRYRKQNQ